MIVLSERDINRETTSQCTEDSKIFNLTPELIHDLCSQNRENKYEGRPPKSSIPFEIEPNEVSFQRKSSKQRIKVKHKDGPSKNWLIKHNTTASQLSSGNFKRSQDMKNSFGRVTLSSDRSKRNIFAKPFSIKSENGSILRLN